MMNSTPAAYPTAAIVDHKSFVPSMSLMDPLSLDYGTGLSGMSSTSVSGVGNNGNSGIGLIGTGVNGISTTQNGQNSHLNHLNTNHPHHSHHGSSSSSLQHNHLSHGHLLHEIYDISNKRNLLSSNHHHQDCNCGRLLYRSECLMNNVCIWI